MRSTKEGSTFPRGTKPLLRRASAFRNLRQRKTGVEVLQTPPKRMQRTLSPGGSPPQHHAVVQFQFYFEVAEEQELLAVDVHSRGVFGQTWQDE